ncbi:hypothetical protein HMPREF9420_2880 [Segatella salivae DSM 15606]|uniref:Uncharacterized protein n=1 Tax=Segatella salivae DSM 15606 TaxID=888832 RepID=E6MTR2_9BACT|nr:hypothetical protein HMPREF9420_2880 [Segatella salivae DSM 15606]
MPNHSGNDFRHARKSQTFREGSCGRPANHFIFPKIDESNNNSKPLMEHIP